MYSDNMNTGSMKVLLIVCLLGMFSPVYSVCSIDSSIACSGDIDNVQSFLAGETPLFITPFLTKKYKFIPKFDFK